MLRIDDSHPRGFQDEEIPPSHHSGTQIHHGLDFLTTPRTRTRRYRDTIAILVRTPCLRPVTSSYIFYHISPRSLIAFKPSTATRYNSNTLTLITTTHNDLRYSPSITFRSWNIFSLDWVRLPHTASPAKWHAFNQQMPRLRYRWEGLAETG